MAYKNMPNQTKMYFDDWKEYVFVEQCFQTDTFHIRRVSDGFYLSAHDNQKHVFWMAPHDNIWTWEQFTFCPENNNLLVTSHGTRTYMDPETDEMWQCEHPEEDPEEDPDSFGHLHPDFVFKPVPKTEEPEAENPKKEQQEKRKLSPKQLGLNLFMKATKEKVCKENPDSAWGDQKKILGTMWKELNESQKANWIKEASEQ